MDLARLRLAVAALLLLTGSAAAERIDRFETEVRLHGDDSFTVVEKIRYDFGGKRTHGIYRDVLVRYGRGQAADYRIDLDVEAVTDPNGRQHPYSVSSRGNIRRIRIGDPDVYVSGSVDYWIRYRVRRGLLWFEDHDELYWNATGSGWEIPILESKAFVVLPSGADAWRAQKACFTGVHGSVEQLCRFGADGDVIYFESRRALAPHEGLTLVVGLPKGVLAEPSELQKWIDRASDYVSGWFALPALAFVALLGLWRRRGRDPKGREAIPVRYEPPDGLRPAEMGTVLDESADIRDITSTVLDLAVRGHLEIEELDTEKFLFFSSKDYELRALRPIDASARSHERELVEALFGGQDRVKISNLKNKFHTRLPGIRKAIYQQLSGQGGYFHSSPQAVRRRWTVGAAAWLLAGFVGFTTDLLTVSGGVALAATGVLFGAFGRAMPRRTKRGRHAYEEILGFREFVERVDKNRLERLGGRTRDKFEAVLPYAVVLGVADEWADAFADIYTEPPSWYHGPSHAGFRPRLFVSDLGRSLETMGQTMQSQPRGSGSGSSGFGGGGFSGGGFGGGGGGSW